MSWVAPWLATALALAAVASAGCGDGREERPPPDPRERAYSAAVLASAARDYDGAIQGFRDAGSYRDAPQRLAEIREEAGEVRLAEARRKLKEGSPRAALSLAEIVVFRYGYDRPKARAFLERARREAARDLRREEREDSF